MYKVINETTCEVLKIFKEEKAAVKYALKESRKSLDSISIGNTERKLYLRWFYKGEEI